METNRRRELMDAYKNRRPEMGIVSYQCNETGERFLACAKDTRAELNGTRFKLLSGTHPNKRLQALWQTHGEGGFTCSVIRVLKYDDPHEDQTDALNALRERCFKEDPDASPVWL